MEVSDYGNESGDRESLNDFVWYLTFSCITVVALMVLIVLARLFAIGMEYFNLFVKFCYIL